MHLFIPSLGRANQMHRGTISKLPKSWMKRTSLVCQYQERKEYARVAEQFGCNILILPRHIDRIEPTRRHIGSVCVDEGIDKFVMMDDDIEFYVREKQYTEDEDWWKLTPPSEDRLEKMLEEIEDDLDCFAHVGLSGREGNNRVREPAVENTRYMRFLAYRTEDYMSCLGDRVHVMEDFDIALQLLCKGDPCLVHYRFAQGQGKTQATGGCSVWRTHEVHNAGAERLAELHPGFVKVRQKQNKTDREGFGTRKEVTVYWKKAFASSQNEEE